MAEAGHAEHISPVSTLRNTRSVNCSVTPDVQKLLFRKTLHTFENSFGHLSQQRRKILIINTPECKLKNSLLSMTHTQNPSPKHTNKHITHNHRLSPPESVAIALAIGLARRSVESRSSGPKLFRSVVTLLFNGGPAGRTDRILLTNCVRTPALQITHTNTRSPQKVVCLLATNLVLR